MQNNTKFGIKFYIIQLVAWAVLMLIAFTAYYFLTVKKSGEWLGLYPFQFGNSELLWLGAGLVIPMLLFIVFLKLAPSMDSIYDPNVKILAESMSLNFMAVYFLLNAFMEEMLFRGALQYHFGLLPAVVLFTLAHISYYKKPLLLAEVFALGVFFGIMYEFCGSIWLCAVCHTVYNQTMMWLIKTGRIDYRPSRLENKNS